MQKPTLVVGGGISGISAALTLLDSGHEFCLITDNLGGRVRYDPQAKVNYGAYFVMGSYSYACRILTPEALLKPTSVLFHNSPEVSFPLLHPHSLARLPDLTRFFFAMRQFTSHYGPYKERCLIMPQKQALAVDPYLADLFSQPASEFIREKGFEQASADYIASFTFACTGVSPEGLTAFDFLNVSTGLIVPIYCFRFDQDALVRRLGGRLVLDSITRILSEPGHYCLAGRSGQEYTAQNVILATPACVTQDLLGLPEIRQSCQLYVWHIRAVLKPLYRRYELNLFPPTSEIMLTARQWDGTYLVYSNTAGADLMQVCETFEILCQVAWEKAMYVQGSAYLDQQPAPGLYLAGDHNGLGLEPAAISGIFAANQIIAKG